MLDSLQVLGPRKTAMIKSLLLSLVFAASSSAFASAPSLNHFQSGLQRTRAALQTAAAQPGELKELLRRFESNDTISRINALNGLKAHVFSSSEARRSVLAAYKNISEDYDIRRRCAKTLSFATMYPAVQDALLSTAENPTEAPDLRGLSYKALYAELSRDESGRSPLIGRIVSAVKTESDPVIRRGAIWALFPVSELPFVNKPLLHIGMWDENKDVRVDALKSLYRAMGDANIAQSVKKIALDKSEDRLVRFPAVLLLSSIRSLEIDDLFFKIVADSSEHRTIRSAASIAFDRQSVHLKYYFRLPRVDQDGSPADPLSAE